MIRFGPAGNSDSFTKQGYKRTEQAAEYLANMGLTAFEYPCGRGVRVGEETARAIGDAMKEHGIAVSLHAPYYISLSSTTEKTRMNSLNYILDSARAVDWLGGNRIIVHSGSATKISREEALELAKDTLQKAQAHLDAEGFSHIHICPETMGKVGQLGTLEEVLELCKIDSRFIPCIDFGHLNARTFGGIQTSEDYATILDKIEVALGQPRSHNFHVHFSRIAYQEPGGETKHLTFEDTEFGPDFAPLAKEIAKRNLTPTIICESAGTQAEDAKAMQDMVERASKR